MKKRILCFGDSNTWGSSPQAARYEDDVRWTGVLARELGEGYTVIEEGYNGRTTVFDDPIEGRLSGVAYFGPCLDTHSPLDLVVIMLGTNDLKTRFGVNAETIAFGFHRYADRLATTPMAGDRPKVLLVSPIEVNPDYVHHPLFYDMFGPDAVARSKQFAPAYAQIAQELGWEFLDAAKYGAASSEDGIHMEEPSHEKLGSALAEKIKEILG